MTQIIPNQGASAISQFTIVVTSISSPNRALSALAEGSRKYGHRFLLIGDEPSPADFALDGCEFYSIARQLQTGLESAASLPTRHYSRKNVGYLLAMREGARAIVETDDDNLPEPLFWSPRYSRVSAAAVRNTGWINLYAYFTDTRIWPRGLPLDAIRSPLPFDSLVTEEVDCPVQQGLANENPDVDAIYRLLMPLPVSFEIERRIALSEGSWCPFNSQNTTWFPDAYILLYLPSTCSFRMTDIWRSFIAQRIAWENDWSVLFENATVRQDRNSHDLMKDFEDEVPGYLNNRRIADTLERLVLMPGIENLGSNLLICYEALIRIGVFDQRELTLVKAWLKDAADYASVPAGQSANACA